MHPGPPPVEALPHALRGTLGHVAPGVCATPPGSMAVGAPEAWVLSSMGEDNIELALYSDTHCGMLPTRLIHCAACRQVFTQEWVRC